MRKLAVLASLIAVAGGFSASHAEAQVVIAPPGAVIVGFDTPTVIAVKSNPLTYVNADAAANEHNLISATPDGGTLYGPDSSPWCGSGGYAKGHCPLFVGKFIHNGETEDIDLRNTVVGQTYTFVCTLHGAMKSTLQIVG